MSALLRRYRLLLVVAVFMCGAALWEVTHRDEEPSSAEDELPYVMRDLYPDSPRVQYAMGVQAVMNGDLRQAKRIFEEILARGEKTNEDLLYYYAVTLVRLESPQSEIEDAVAQWRFNFPYSTRDDPREVTAKQLESQARSTHQPISDKNGTE